MRRFKLRLARSAATAASIAGSLFIAAAAHGQSAPTPQITRSPPTWLGYVIVMVLLIAVVAVSLMPSKRSHQD